MLREKRIRKPPVNFTLMYSAFMKPAAKSEKKNRNRKRCEFKTIPDPSKFINNFKIHHLYGDIFLTEKNDMISLELSVISKFKVFKNVEINQKVATRTIQVLVEPKEGFEAKEWEQIVKKMESSPRIESKRWAFLIQNFSQKYENFMRELQERDYKVAINEEEEKEHFEITLNSEKTKAQLLEFVPSICIKSRLEGSNIHITELTFNELLVRDLGYSIDSFVTSVFQEGIPQLISHDSETLLNLAQDLLENYFKIGPDGIISSESNLQLILRSGYVRNAQAHTHLLLNYENGGFGVDIVISIMAKQEPFFDHEKLSKKIINTDFIQDMAIKENNSIQFLSRYYNEFFTPRYNNFEKVCNIREISELKDERLSIEE